MARHAKNEFFGHFVWATWDRLPLIAEAIREPVFRVIRIKCDQLGCHVFALNGTENHVHLVVQLAGTVSQSQLMHEVKGASSHWINHHFRQDQALRWQGTYGAFSFSRQSLPKVIAYVDHQEERHRQGTILTDLEETEQETTDKSTSTI